MENDSTKASIKEIINAKLAHRAWAAVSYGMGDYVVGYEYQTNQVTQVTTCNRIIGEVIEVTGNGYLVEKFATGRVHRLYNDNMRPFWLQKGMKLESRAGTPMTVERVFINLSARELQVEVTRRSIKQDKYKISLQQVREFELIDE